MSLFWFFPLFEQIIRRPHIKLIASPLLINHFDVTGRCEFVLYHAATILSLVCSYNNMLYSQTCASMQMSMK